MARKYTIKDNGLEYGTPTYMVNTGDEYGVIRLNGLANAGSTAIERASLKSIGLELSLKDILGLAGMPAVRDVYMSSTYKNAKIVFDGYSIFVAVESSNVRLTRSIYRDHVHNGYFVLNREHQGGGRGMNLIAVQMRNAARWGMKYLDNHSAKGSDMNGYYTWPRLGFNEALTASQIRVLQANGLTVDFSTTVLDVMSTEEGRRVWKECGSDLYNAKFDLTPRSKSRLTFSAYVRDRSAKAA